MIAIYDISRTPQDTLLMTWDRTRHHFEIEAFNDGICEWFEWFYADREAEYYEGGEWADRMPPRAIGLVNMTRGVIGR